MRLPLHLWTTGDRLVGVSTDLNDDHRRDLRTLIGDAAPVDDLLDLLASDGLARTVPFLIAAAEAGGVRLLLRGAVEVTLTLADGSQEVRGAGRAATWLDDVVPDVVDLSVATGDDGRFEWVVPDVAEPDVTEPVAVEVAETPAPAVDPEPVDVEPEPIDPEPEPVEIESEPVEPEPEPAEIESVDDDPAPMVDSLGGETVTELDLPVEPDVDETPGLDDPDEPTEPVDPAAPDYSGLLGRTVYDRVPEGAPGGAPVAPPAPPTDTLDVGPDGSGLIGRTLYGRVDAHAEPTGGPEGGTALLTDVDPAVETTGPTEPYAPAEPYRPSEPGAGEVLAVHCPAGHPNRPGEPACRACGQPVADQTVTVIDRPVLARIVFENGPTIDVDRTQIIGRGPVAPTGVVEQPNLITVPNPDGDLSREHTAIRIEGWDVIIEDLGSTNGTEVHLPGREPQRLHDHDPILVVPGTRVVLAGAVRFIVEAPAPS